jgi:hypothetical protein
VKQFASLLVIVLIIVAARHLPHLLGDELSRLRMEWLRHMPVYSAETTQGKEAEFIRDRLPTRFPYLLALGAVVAFGAVSWWLNR